MLIALFSLFDMCFGLYLKVKDFCKKMMANFVSSLFELYSWGDAVVMKLHNQLEYKLVMLREFFNIKVLAY